MASSTPLKMGIKEARRKVKEGIRTAGTFDPDLPWAFDIQEIPTDQNVSDYVLGAMELARILGKIKKNALKPFILVYTQAGKPRDDRPAVGRPFKYLDGQIITLQGKPLEGGTHAPKGTYGKHTIEGLPYTKNFATFEKYVFDGEVMPMKRLVTDQGGPSSKRPKANKKSKSKAEEHFINTSDSGEDFEGRDEESDKETFPLNSIPPLKFRWDPTDKPQKIQDLELQFKLEQQELEIKSLCSRLEIQEKAAERSAKGYTDAFEVLIQSAANLNNEVITHTLKKSLETAVELAQYSVGADELFLEHIERHFVKTLKVLKQDRRNTDQLNDLIANPNSDKARISRGMVSDEVAAELKKEREEALTAVQKKMDIRREEALRDFRKRVEAERQEFEDQTTAEIDAALRKEQQERNDREEQERRIMVQEAVATQEAAYIGRVRQHMVDDGVPPQDFEDLDMDGAWKYTAKARRQLMDAFQKMVNLERADAVKQHRNPAPFVTKKFNYNSALKHLKEVARDISQLKHKECRRLLTRAGEVWDPEAEA